MNHKGRLPCLCSGDGQQAQIKKSMIHLYSFNCYCSPLYSLVLTNTTKLTDCNCGIANTASRIVGGVDTEENEYPWQVLFHAEDSMGRVGMCGGTILNKR